jgi:hypothetical protein
MSEHQRWFDFVRSLIVDVLAKVYLPTSSVSLASTLRIEALLETIGWARVPNQLTASEALSQTLTFP